MYAKKHKVYFNDDGIPFIILAQKFMDCHHGVDRQIAAKEKRKQIRNTKKVYIFSNSVTTQNRPNMIIPIFIGYSFFKFQNELCHEIFLIIITTESL